MDVSSKHPVLILVMGVSGSGKSTIGSLLADSLALPFVDADDLHPKENVAKMSSGHPLTDEDRFPWLEIVRKAAEQHVLEQDADPNFRGRRGVVVACSALKKKYRDILRGVDKPRSVPEHLDPPHPHDLPAYIAYIKGDRDLLFDRMHNRKNHFMKAQMLDSQLTDLESPEEEPGVVVIRLEDSTEKQVSDARDGLTKLAGSF
ncbi:carbohydrate kinase [Rickenella mellea]|uniref:Gluconokinase n=1 Tax=Rickenella mellea TaxID=50990 RepID=A0A4Y7QPV6_9AGAM|nr:carbohydrate kinase [Rickenella mellea]